MWHITYFLLLTAVQRTVIRIVNSKIALCIKHTYTVAYPRTSGGLQLLYALNLYGLLPGIRQTGRGKKEKRKKKTRILLLQMFLKGSLTRF